MDTTLNETGKKAPVITIDDSQLREHVSEVVKQTVEDTLNALLDAEADELCRAQKYERSPERAAHALAIMRGISKPLQAKSVSRCLNCAH